MLVTLTKKRHLELYQVKLCKKGLLFKIKKSLYRYLYAEYATAPMIKEQFRSIPCTTNENIAYLEIPFPVISTKIDAVKQQRRKNEELKTCVSNIALLFDLLNFSFEAHDVSRKYLSKQPQLLFVECFQNTKGGLGSNYIEVGLNQKIRKLLAYEYPNGGKIISSERTTAQRCSKFFHKKNLESSSTIDTAHEIKIIIQSGGIPEISIPGDCACLGRHAKDYTQDGVLHSNNVDSPAQMLAMIISVISFWNEVLTPLYQKNK